MPDLIKPIGRPDIIVPDATPLIHLALIGQLGLLHGVGGAVLLVDVVADEAARRESKPGAREIALWIEAGQRPGSNAPVRIAETETGRAIFLARQADPAFRAPNAGEVAIVEWLATTVQGSAEAIVIYENGRVPAIVANQGIADIDVVTTRLFGDRRAARTYRIGGAPVGQGDRACADRQSGHPDSLPTQASATRGAMSPPASAPNGRAARRAMFRTEPRSSARQLV